MTNEMKYSELLKEIGALLADKNTTISCQRYQIDELSQRLKMAEAERDEAVAKNASEKHLLLDSEAINALRSVNETLRECYNSMTENGGCAAYVETLEIAQLVLSSVLPIEGGAA